MSSITLENTENICFIMQVMNTQYNQLKPDIEKE
jgi:hypothetical protein